MAVAKFQLELGISTGMVEACGSRTRSNTE